jgi:branched-chain amino acid transport system permease protein
MTDVVQQIVVGLSIGLVFAGIALALNVVYQGTGVLNFAQGEMAVFSAFLAWALVREGLPFWLALPAVLVLSFVVGFLVQRVFVRPVERASELSVLIVTLALFMAFNATTGALWGHTPQEFASPFGEHVWDVGGVLITAHQVGMAAVLSVTLLLVGLFFRLTDTGLRMRAAAQNPDSSRLLGIRVGRTLAFGWGLASVVGGVAGIMAAPVLGLAPDMMTSTLLLGFAAAALGGFGSRVGAVVGGVVIGLLSTLAGAYVPGLGGDLNVVVPFLVIVSVLLLRPAGLFGTPSTLRV